MDRGDRDGNPSVKASVTLQTLRLQRKLAIREYQRIMRELMQYLSFSTSIVNVTPELLESIEADRNIINLNRVDAWRNDNEPYRIKLSYMISKTQNVLDDEKKEHQSATQPRRNSSTT